MNGLSIVTLGSLKIDILVQLRPDADPATDLYAVEPIDIRVGGTAGTFCAAAVGQFAKISAIAAIGDDAFTPLLRKRLAELGVTAHLQPCPGSANGMVLSLLHGANGGRRILIASEQSAHLHLSTGHVERAQESIASADALVCDGYFLRSPTSANALLAAMDIATRADVPVVFDVVPHALPATTSLPSLTPYLDAAQMIVVEARTLVGLHEHRWPLTEPSDETLASRAAHYARQTRPEATWLIRYGINNIGSVLRLAPDGSQITYSSKHTQESDQWGFGDKLLVRELFTELC